MHAYTTALPQRFYRWLMLPAVLIGLSSIAAIVLDAFDKVDVDDFIYLWDWQRDHDFLAMMIFLFAPMVLGMALGIYSASVGWSSNFYRISAGEVINAVFTPAHMGTRTQLITSSGVGANGAVSVTNTPVQVPHWYEDSWYVVLRDTRGHTGTIYVSKDDFDAHPVGTYYSGTSS